MQVIRSVISLFLLLVYSISFAHDLIPHCHFSEITEQIASEHGHLHHHLKNHKHAKFEDLDDDDILHENHLDDSLFDFVICLLSELEHPASEIPHHHYVPVNTNDNPKNEPTKFRLVSVLVSVFNLPIVTEPLIPTGNDTTLVLEVPDIISSPHRGPPLIS
ncbi:MAG: hypothetical protein MRY83_05215 [Flavobacteriales bacterium]|nr:hypothetical protein [Flavobacteriales bacterium]